MWMGRSTDHLTGFIVRVNWLSTRQEIGKQFVYCVFFPLECLFILYINCLHQDTTIMYLSVHNISTYLCMIYENENFYKLNVLWIRQHSITSGQHL